MIPSSFCTICTSTCVNELKGFLMSLSLFHPNERIYILCDSLTKNEMDEFISNKTKNKMNNKTNNKKDKRDKKDKNNKINLQIEWLIELDKYTNLNRSTMEMLGVWSDFQMSKSIVIDKALEKENDTLFLDCDIILLGKIDDIPIGGNGNDYDIGVSPGFVNEEIEMKYGKYNGGMLWVKNKEVPEKWREFTKSSRYFDQASIEDLVRTFKCFVFGDNYNLQTWRFIVGEEHATTIMSYISPRNGYIQYKKKELKFIHTHFNSKQFTNINHYFKLMIKSSNMMDVLKCVEAVENS